MARPPPSGVAPSILFYFKKNKNKNFKNFKNKKIKKIANHIITNVAFGM
jgi:hypothetical protein